MQSNGVQTLYGFNLNMELTRYLNKVIGMTIPIFNEVQPSMMYQSPNKGIVDIVMNLPTTQDTLGKFLTHQWVDRANIQTIRTFLLAALYHEAAHDLSGEIGELFSTEDRSTIEHHSLRDFVAYKIQPKTDQWAMPAVIMNIVNDVNDYAFSPQKWPGMASIHGALGRIMFWMGDPIEPMTRAQVKAIPNEDRPTQEFNRLHKASLWLMRNLKVRYGPQIVRKINTTDPLCLPFNEVKTVMKDLRREKVPQNRERFYFGLYDAMLIHWKWCGGTEQEFRDFLNAQRQQLTLPTNIFGQGSGTGSVANNMQGALDSLAQQGNHELESEGSQKKPKGSSRGKTLRGGRGKGKHILSEPSSLSPHVDQGNLRRLYRSMETKICERIRQANNDDADVKGAVLAPIHFTDIYTRPKQARLWRGGDGVSTTISGHIVGVWDRSWSMDERVGSYTKADITKETVCTMHAAIYAHNRLRIDHICYDTNIERIKFSKGTTLQQQLLRIAGALDPQGGTEAPSGIHEANQIFSEVHAQRRLMIVVTDGDLYGRTYSLDAEIATAKKRRVDICVIGLNTSVDHLRSLIPEENIFTIEDCMELPEIIDSLVLSRT